MKSFTTLNSGKQFSKESFWLPVKLSTSLNYISGFTPFDKILNRETAAENSNPGLPLELIFRQEWLELILSTPTCNYSAGIMVKSIKSIINYSPQNKPAPAQSILISVTNIPVTGAVKSAQSGVTMALTHSDNSTSDQAILISFPEPEKLKAYSFFQKCFPRVFNHGR